MTRENWKKHVVRGIACLLAGCGMTATAAADELPAALRNVASGRQATVGVAVSHGAEGEIASVNNRQYPMMSVFKFHLALTVLDLVDRGKLALQQPVRIAPGDLRFKEYSPLRDKYPEGSDGVPLLEILTATVSSSDNNGCDILLNLIGGPETVDRFIKSKGIKNTTIAVTEHQLHMGPDFLMSNTSTPEAAVRLLKLFDQGRVLSKESTALLKDIMMRTTTGSKRLKGRLPEGTVVAHKTGSGPRIDGVAVACNDIGIVTLPDGTPLYIAAFVAQSRENDETNERIIADAARAAWDAYAPAETAGEP